MKSKAGLVLAIAVVFGGHGAQAADYIFRVPVDLKDIPPQLTTLEVYCQVGGKPGIAGSNNLGNNSKSMPIAAGSFLGVVEVDVTRNAVAPGTLPDAWVCLIKVKGLVDNTLRTWTAQSVDSGNPAILKFQTDSATPTLPPNLPANLPAKPGTTPVAVARGNLPTP